MAKLDQFLERKVKVLADRREDFTADPEAGVKRLTATSQVAGLTGVRATQIGNHFIASDSGEGLAGHDLGPTSTGMLLGALASCLVHTYLIQAALHNIPLDHVEVETSGEIDYGEVVGLPYQEDDPPRFRNMSYTASVASPAAADDIERLHAAVWATCPVLNTIKFDCEIERIERETTTDSE